MAENFKLNKELQNYYRERDTILDEVCTGQINNELLKAAIIKCTDNLIYHLMRLIENSQVKPRKQERNKNNKSRNTKEERKIMQLRKEEKKQRFEEIVISYQKSEFTQENWHKNECKD